MRTRVNVRAGWVVWLGLFADAGLAAEPRALSELHPQASAPLPLGERLVLEGWVTYVSPEDRLLALVDGFAGQVFSLHEGHGFSGVSTGQWLRVETTVESRAGWFLLRDSLLLPSGGDTARGRFPPPQRTDIHQLQSGRFTGGWVTLEATVRSVMTDAAEGRVGLLLQLAQDQQRFSAAVASEGTGHPGLRPGDRVLLTGVFAPRLRAKGRRMESHLLLQDAAQIRVLNRGPEDGFGLFPSPLGEVHAASRPPPLGAMVRIQGQVSHALASERLWMESEGVAVQVHVAGSLPALAPGARVDVVGFKAVRGGVGHLQDAVVRALGDGSPPVPTRVDPNPDTGEDWLGHLVRCHGRLLVVHREVGGLRLGLTSASGPFEALLRSGFERVPDFEPGAELAVTGICGVWHAEGMQGEAGDPIGFSILLRNAGDIQVLQPAPYWNADRLRRFYAWGGSILLCAGLWIVTLRVQVVRRSRRLAAEIQARRVETDQFSVVLAERRRLAADLHDSLEQSLTGVSLQLQAAEQAKTKAPLRLEHHLDLARRLLEQGRAELRRSVWDLRSEALDLHDLPGALREMSSRQGWEDRFELEVREEGGPRAVPDLIANHLLRIAQEAIHNAVKSGGATRMEVVLSHQVGAIRFRLSDNGSGFEPSAAPGPRMGHFGLNTMRERAERLGGRLEVSSAPGQGTVIQVELPVTTASPESGTRD